MPGCTIVTGVSPHSLEVDTTTRTTLEGASRDIMVSMNAIGRGKFGE